MSEVGNAIDGIIEQKLLDTHIAYLAKVINVNGNRLSIQPLQMYKEYGMQAKEYPVLTNIPYIQRRFRMNTTANTHKHDIAKSENVGEIETIDYTHSHELIEDVYVSGDIVLAVVCERDITYALQGKTALPYTNNRNNLQSSIVIGKIA